MQQSWGYFYPFVCIFQSGELCPVGGIPSTHR